MNVIIKIEANEAHSLELSLAPTASCIFSYILNSRPPPAPLHPATPLFNRFSQHKGWVLWGECNFLCVFFVGGDGRRRCHYATACWEYFNYKALARFMIALPLEFYKRSRAKVIKYLNAARFPRGDGAWSRVIEVHGHSRVNMMDIKFDEIIG